MTENPRPEDDRTARLPAAPAQRGARIEYGNRVGTLVPAGP
ncbi:hypothetical protein ACGFMO_18180 [Streptomyces niveus]